MEMNSWNSELLGKFIAAEDIPHVESLRLSRTGRRDCYSWDFTKSGLYTVKSGYSVAYDLRTASYQAVISEPSTTELKKAAWKIKAPRKLKHFIWQAISGFVAMAQRLRDRHCVIDSTCVRCGAESETINHTLFECPSALQCWALSQIPANPGLFPRPALFENIDYLLWRAKENGVSAETMKAFPWILWYIWKANNEKLFNNRDITPMETLQLAMSEAGSWTLAQMLPVMEETGIDIEQSDGHAETVAPAIPRWRCQVDASWVSTQEAVGVGFVMMEEGATILYGGKKTNNTESPLYAEAEGLIWAMQEALGREFTIMHFETDFQQLVKLIKNDEEEWPAMATELDEIKAIASNSTSSLSRTYQGL